MRIAGLRAGLLSTGLVIAGAVLGPRHADAYTTASLTTPIAHARYLACRDEPASRVPPPPTPRAKPDDELLPVPRVRWPGKLTVIPHLVDDAALAEPIPDRAPDGAAERPASPPVPIVMRESVNGIHCLGLLRGRAAMMRALAAPPGTHFYGHPDPRDFITDNMIAASAFDAKEAVAPIRVALDRALPRQLASHEDLERVSMQGHAAMALAELGDVESAPKIRALLVALETLRVGSTWRDTFQALRSLDRATVAGYAVDFVERMTDGKTPPVSGHDLEVLLEAIDARDAARARPALLRIGTSGHDGCLAVGARLRLGDEALARTVRPDLEGSIATNLGATCWSQIVAALAPGRSVSELSVLLFRARWVAIAELALVLRGRGPGAAGDRATFLAKVRATTARSPRGLRDHDHIHRLGALAALGDEAALRDLLAIVDAPGDDSDGPWVAAVYAVHAALPEAQAHAQRLLLAGAGRAIANGEVDALTSGVAATWPVKLVRELARQRSPLVALGLLQRDGHAREEAMFAVSRAKPEGACELVANAAALARDPEIIDSAFWALTALGSRCRPAMERLARDPAQPGHVRGMAIEHLAMIRAPSTEALAAAWTAEGPRSSTEQASLQRTRILLRSPE